ncbi:MAG TPA: hypothetical protein VMS88_03090, partial [Terriglobales bacterium]|nr:hypothetical protein [Terriglobales bacterium]
DVNGFPAEQVIVTCVGKAKSKEKGEEAGELRMVMDEWLTKNAPGTGEVRAYYKSFAEKIGFDAQMSGMSSMARRMYGNGMRELTTKLKDLDGYPVRTTFTIEGPSGASRGQSAAEAQAQAKAQQDQAKAARDQAKKAEAAEEKAEDAQAAADAASGKGSLTGKLGGFLGRKVARAAQKKAEDKAEKQAEEMSSPGSGAAAGGPLFKVVTDVVSISTSPAPAGSFEVPAGFKLQQPKKN